jgi:hypothetical protein
MLELVASGPGSRGVGLPWTGPATRGRHLPDQPGEALQLTDELIQEQNLLVQVG